MKKNYTLRLALAILVVVLVSLVSFVGVYKGGKNWVKDYSLGKDFSKRKIAAFSVVEDKSEQNEESTEQKENEGENVPENSEEKEDSTNQNNNQNQPLSEKDKMNNYQNAKNNISSRISNMKLWEYIIRVEDESGKLVIEVPEDVDSSILNRIVTKGKIEIKNTSSNEIIADGNVFKDASANIDKTNSEAVIINLKFSDEAKKKIIDSNPNYTDSEGKESEAIYDIMIDGNRLTDGKINAGTFIEAAQKNGYIDLYMGRENEKEMIDDVYQRAIAIASIIKKGEIPVNYEVESINVVSSNIDVKLIVIACAIIGVIMVIFAVYKFKLRGLFSAVSLIGFVATSLLVLRYTNVKITLFTILGLAVVTVANYMAILKTLNNKKTFKESFMDVMNAIIPCIIVAIVFCCSPYLQLASFGMSIFWGLIVMCVYDASIVRMIIEK